MRKVYILACASMLLVAVPPRPSDAAMPVFDPTNYAQNLLQAARALEQINNQVRALQNQATMLQLMGKDLERIDFPQLGQVTAAIRRVDQLMGQARGIDFKVDQLEQKFRALYPGASTAPVSAGGIAAARERLEAAMAGFRHSMTVQSQVVENVREDAALLAELGAQSQNATGNLQVSQATNQLLALATKQQFQLQALMAAEFRSAGLERARRVQAEQDARAATKRFLGSGRAYTRP